MAAPQRQSIDSERPNSLHDAVQPDNNAYNGYIEDDIYGIYGLGDIPVSDGFRPPQAAQNHDRISPLPSPSIDLDPANIPLPSSPPPTQRPTSAIKPVRIDDFALRHDGRMGPLNPESTATPNESSEAPSLSRTTSMTSEGPILISEGPYVGPTRPSHAYHMYGQSNRPQRTASVATASSFNMPAERTYSGPSGPAHPYALYPQNTVPEDDTTVLNANIPIGFNNLAGQQYQRRIGPDGEDVADLIGPHGHTEELPPYTKYPDEAYARKMRENRAPSERAPSIRSGGPRESVDVVGAGGIGLATRNPEFSSNEELSPRAPSSTQTSRESTRLSAVSTHSAAPVTIPNPELSEKPPELEIIDPRWKKRARNKVCGIVPVWALCLAISVIVAVALLLGITLGIVLNNKAEDRRKELDTSFDSHGGYAGFPETGKYITTVTTTVDASPLPLLPSDLPALPVGNYSLVIPPAMPTRNQCLGRLDHLSSWSCAMPSITLQLSITNLGNYSPKTHNKAVYIQPEDAGNSWSYGTQPPRIEGSQPAMLVDDLDDSEYGPAWFFQVAYPKLVVLQESTFSTLLTTLDMDADLTPETPSGTTVVREGYDGYKRDVVDDPAAEKHKRATDRVRKGVAQPGDKPWFCYWNGTLLEVFIYPNTTSDAGDAQIAASKASAKAALPTNIIPYAVETSKLPPWKRYHRYTESASSTTSSTASTPTPTVIGAAVPDPSSAGGAPSSTETVAQQTGWPLYPLVVKLEERRMPRNPGFDQPYCKQKIIGSDGVTTTDVVNGDGHGSSIVLSEKLVSQARAKRRLQPWNAQGSAGLDVLERATKEARRAREAKTLEKRDLDGECHCIWMVE